MAIITMTTDLGTSDHYVGMIKGALLRLCPTATIIDITHNINPFDIVQAAFVLRHSFREFSAGTIHLVNVNNANRIPDHFLAFEKDGHFFVGPDNGLFSLVFDELPQSAFLLPFDPLWRFPIKEHFSRAAAHLVEKKPLKELGEPVDEILKRISLQPVITPSGIQGHIIHIDHYGNAILNIHRELFERTAEGRDFTLYFKTHEPLHRICAHYAEVEIGEALCRFNSTSYLEIAVNMGRASELLGLNEEDAVQIDFIN
jgi:S-adenosylmethionine hydrolase